MHFLRYISGRFGTQEVAERWKHKYQEVCNALDMVGFQEQVSPGAVSFPSVLPAGTGFLSSCSSEAQSYFFVWIFNVTFRPPESARLCAELFHTGCLCLFP